MHQHMNKRTQEAKSTYLRNIFESRAKQDSEYLRNVTDMQVCQEHSDTPAVVEQSVHQPCSQWQEASRMWEEWRRFTAEWVTALLICGYCGRGCFAGTHTSEKRFKFIIAENQDAPPILAFNPFLARFVGSFRR